MSDIVWVSPQGHRSVSVSCHFLLQAPQCPCSVRKWFSRDHCCRGRSKFVYLLTPARSVTTARKSTARLLCQLNVTVVTIPAAAAAGVEDVAWTASLYCKREQQSRRRRRRRTWRRHRLSSVDVRSPATHHCAPEHLPNRIRQRSQHHDHDVTMHDQYIAEICRSGAIFLPLTDWSIISHFYTVSSRKDYMG